MNKLLNTQMTVTVCDNNMIVTYLTYPTQQKCQGNDPAVDICLQDDRLNALVEVLSISKKCGDYH